MNRYTDDTFDAIWGFMGVSEESYMVLHNTLTDTYHVYRSFDVEEIAHTNYVVKDNYTKLTGNFPDFENYYYIIAQDNTLHCDTGPAAFVPFGLSGFQPREDVKHYIVHGKIMSQYSWLTWVKNTASWPKAMASLLGAKNSC